ncbi:MULTISPECIES: AAA family ATPase [Streptomyces]|uniref:AAA family ATPase n=1 Tax=Streptomyces TaxID=1883 RepID=UPI00188493B0|nr:MULTISPECIES: MoxR family ATPase [Streptomyces]MBF8169320.1 AAA family ATPase [Streptomyces olivaceus]MBZ6137522.1 MoxR family ATPase [Streptomyces olivaceus]MBZ6165723.1 MoxR family ATPase [Streptomyces olivaceus]MBZ6174010.1 MoxR family ATPase [Streptomyces olivaceus]MBZ6180188.1 MoxR family ATPase [Streptomyces olivaceus]
MTSAADADNAEWRLFRGDGTPRSVALPSAPPWRRFVPTRSLRPELPYVIAPQHADVVNAALHLRRPLLVTGPAGTGKSSLARAVTHELSLGELLRWPVNSRSTVKDALYQYDAIGRLRETTLSRDRGEREPSIGTFVRLGPLGTALVPSTIPRCLLIDEMDKGDVDLPNDLLTVFEEGFFDIPELTRLPEDMADVDVQTHDHRGTVHVHQGLVQCAEFPVVVITSNGERDFPPAFLRRCLRLDLPLPDEDRLRTIVAAHLGEEAMREADDLIEAFLRRRALGELATDQLLNAVFLRTGGVDLDAEGLLDAVLHQLTGAM